MYVDNNKSVLGFPNCDILRLFSQIIFGYFFLNLDLEWIKIAFVFKIVLPYSSEIYDMIKQKRPDGLVCYIVTQVYEHIQFFDTIRKKNEIFYS